AGNVARAAHGEGGAFRAERARRAVAVCRDGDTEGAGRGVSRDADDVPGVRGVGLHVHKPGCAEGGNLAVAAEVDLRAIAACAAEFEVETTGVVERPAGSEVHDELAG